MTQIFQYVFAVNDEDQVQSMPTWGLICDVQMQGHKIVLWALVETDAPRVNRTFRVFGTGVEIPAGYSYLRTMQEPPFVWHLFEKTF